MIYPENYSYMCVSDHALLLVNSGVQKSTRNTYASLEKTYKKFCNNFCYSSYPTSRATLLAYIAYLDLLEYPHSTIRVHLAAIRFENIIRGFDYSLNDLPEIKLALRAIDRKSGPPKQKLPITQDILLEMRSLITSSQEDCLIWAAMCLAHAGFLRVSELTNFADRPSLPSLRKVDIEFLHQGVRVQIRRSKTDPKGSGHTLTLPCIDSPLCPRCSLHTYMQSRLDTCEPAPCAFFVFRTGEFLTRSVFSKMVSDLLTRLGYHSGDYGTHSFRAGAATSAALAGLQPWEIKQLGRWKSDAYMVYIRPPKLSTSYSKLYSNSIKSN